MNDEQRKQLDEQGYLIFKGLLSPDQIESLLARLEELWRIEGENAGEENYIEPGVRRLANLANKGDIFRKIYGHPQVLEVVQTLMGPEMRASMVNARDVPPHTGVRMCRARKIVVNILTLSARLSYPQVKESCLGWMMSRMIETQKEMYEG